MASGVSTPTVADVGLLLLVSVALREQTRNDLHAASADFKCFVATVLATKYYAGTFGHHITIDVDFVIHCEAAVVG